MTRVDDKAINFLWIAKVATRLFRCRMVSLYRYLSNLW